MVEPYNVISKKLHLSTDKTNFDMNIDAWTSSKDFIFNKSIHFPSSEDYVVLTRIFIIIRDATDFTPILYGGIGWLTNGSQLLLNGQELFNIKQNSDLAIICYDVGAQILDAQASTKTQFTCSRITFSRFAEDPITGIKGIIFKNNNDTLTFRLRDNLSGLTLHQANVQGYKLSKNDYEKLINK